MKRDLKQDILETARQLFNERGYNNVSLRDIAEALGISVGNLTYHYNKKEDLIEALVLQMHENYQRKPVPQNLAELWQFFQHSQQHYREHLFYFAHYTQLAQLSPTIQEIQQTVMRHHYENLLQALTGLRHSGLVAAEQFPGQDEQAVRNLLLTMIYWLPLKRLEIWPGGEDDFPQNIRAQLYPLLTERGREELRRMVK